MKLLITGGCGFLGSNLACYAIKNKYEVVIFDNLYRKGSLDNLNWLKQQGSFNFEHGDIRNRNDVDNLISNTKPDAIFHLAGQVAMTTSIVNARMDFEVNAIGTFNLLEAVRLYTPKATVIYSSTNKVYGDLGKFNYKETETRYICTDKPNGFDEYEPMSFHSPYGCSKGSADQYMLDYSRIFNINTVVFRHSSMFGGRQFATYDQGWIGWFCQQAVNVKQYGITKPFTISGNGKQVRDVLYADDMINLYFIALAKIDSIKGMAFNIGGGIKNSLSLLELFELLEKHLTIKLHYKKLPFRQSDQKIFVADTSLANKMLGWQPNISKDAGIKKILTWLTTTTND